MTLYRIWPKCAWHLLSLIPNAVSKLIFCDILISCYSCVINHQQQHVYTKNNLIKNNVSDHK